MNELLQALQAAANAGFDAPPCNDCHGNAAWAGIDGEGWYECPACHATGLDASDPERLIGRAMADLHCNRRMSLHRIGADIDSDLIKLPPMDDDGDRQGEFATALLRLVTRFGAPQETT